MFWWHNVKKLVLMRWNGDSVAQDLPRIRSPWRAHTGAAASAVDKVKEMAGRGRRALWGLGKIRGWAPLAMNEI
ncbi:hypothetical protein B2M20_12935 [Nitrobacter vulgaris]|uniref:Uncharacterized protein n=1 Tax=Nitrobacter vulgaris TaxID=29421 RepID=A0A1V4HVT4_NITVU|nr:hypothetical protein B2M20_12935 [Nitrobacter vulgaris]